MNKTRIGILGMGGTGGFFGGKLAMHYKGDDRVDVVFIARNETKQNLLEHGLNVESVEGDFTVSADVTSDDAHTIGQLDVLLVCVKSYSLETAINAYKHQVREDGVVITIQNLVNQAERIENILPPKVHLLEGCTYIISNIVRPGHIRHNGGPATIYFGRDRPMDDFRWVERLFIDAGIRATLSDQIASVIWRKFLLISPMAVATSYFSCTIGVLRADSTKVTFLRALMNELFELIRVKRVDLESTAIDAHLQLMRRFPENGKTSMQLDIERGKPSEIRSLLVYVLEEAAKYDLKPTHYQEAYSDLGPRVVSMSS